MLFPVCNDSTQASRKKNKLRPIKYHGGSSGQINASRRQTSAGSSQNHAGRRQTSAGTSQTSAGSCASTQTSSDSGCNSSGRCGGGGTIKYWHSCLWWCPNNA
jgi:hypothetical protein